MKNRRSFLMLVLALTGLLFANPRVACQETSVAAAKSAEQPDSPSTVQATTCTENNGKPCPEWVHRLVGQYPPRRVEIPKREPGTVRFWTYRGFQDPPLRTNREVLHSKLFLAAHVGGAVAMIVACKTKGSGEEFGSEVPAVAAMGAIDYLSYRFIGAPHAIGPPIYEMVHYGLSTARAH